MLPHQRPINHVILPLFLLELLATGCLIVIFYYMKYLDNFTQRRYPILCDDLDWISYPYYSNTSHLPLYLGDAGMYSASFLIPIIMVVLVELVQWFFYTGEKKVVIPGCTSLKLYFFPRRVIRIIGNFIAGAFLTLVVTFTLKYMFAVPRPCFLHACRANATALAESCGGGSGHFLTFTPSERTCLASRHQVDWALRSFPEEHAVLPAFCGAYLALYLHRMLSVRYIYTFRPALLALVLIGAVTPGIGSYQAFYNRWQDLLAGYLLGTAGATYMAWASLQWFKVRVRSAPQPLTLDERHLSPADVIAGPPTLNTILEDEKSYQGQQNGQPAVIPRAKSLPANKIFETTNHLLISPSSDGSYHENHAYNGEHVRPRY